MSGKNQITGGAFQDAEGNRLSYGSITMQLSHDEQEAVDPGQVVGGLPVVVELDQNGNVAGTVSVWPNDQLNPANSYYVVNAFNVNGEQAWLSPQNFIIPSSPSPYNLGTAIPQGVPGSSPSLLLQTNGVNNPVQVKLNQVAGTNMAIVADNAGDVTFSVVSGFPVNWHGFTATGNNNLSPFSTSPGSSGISAQINATATEPTYLQLTTGSGANSQAYLFDNSGNSPGNKQITLGVLDLTKYRVQLVGTTNERVWIGFTDAAAGSGLVTDNPNQSICAFRYSTHASDGTWQCYCGTSSSAFTSVSSGIAPDLNGHAFQIEYDGTNVNFFIDGTNVANVATNQPSTSTLMQNGINVDNVNIGNAISVNVGYSFWITKG